jgi:hypothetical protein
MLRVLVGGLVTDMVAEPSERDGVPADRDLVGGALSVRALVAYMVRSTVRNQMR